jgi:hypothetical protein
VYGPGVQKTFGDAEGPSVQAHLSGHRPGFWAILSTVLAASWLGGAAAVLLWGLICCFAVVDVLLGSPQPKHRPA